MSIYIPSMAGGNWSVAASWNPEGVPGAADEVQLTEGGNITVDGSSACIKLTRTSGHAGEFNINNALDVNGDLSLGGTNLIGGTGAVAVAGSLTIACDTSLCTGTMTVDAASGAKTITMNGNTWGGALTIANAGVTSFTAQDALSYLGAYTQSTATSKMAFANGVTNAFKSYTLTAGTLVDGNASTVNNAIGASGTGANIGFTGGTLTTLATWAQTVSGNFEAAQSLAPQKLLQPPAGYISTVYSAAISYVRSFQKNGGTTALGTKALIIYWPSSDFWTDGAGSFTASTGYIGVWLNATITQATAINVGTMKFTVQSQAATVFRLSMASGAALTCGQLSQGSFLAKYYGSRFSLGSGAHTIASYVRASPDTESILDLDTSTIALSGTFNGVGTTVNNTSCAVTGSGAASFVSTTIVGTLLNPTGCADGGGNTNVFPASGNRRRRTLLCGRRAA